MRAARVRIGPHPLERGSWSTRELSAKTRRRGSQRVSRHQHRECRTVIERAGEWSGKARLRIDATARSQGHNLCVHCTVVRSVPAAARRQACVRAAVDEGRQRPESEEQDQEDGEAAPHQNPMLADSQQHVVANLSRHCILGPIRADS